MNHRLVWNFNMDDDKPLDLGQLPDEEPASLRWEARYFWRHDEDVTIHGLERNCLDLSAFKLKQRRDAYFLLPDKPYNIKKRRGEILYKPLMEKKNACLAFGKKINLYECPAHQVLPGTPAVCAADLLEAIQRQGQEVQVEKTAMIYRFETSPPIKLELARLNIANTIFFSVCVEGRSQTLVSLISKHLLNQQISCDYVTFLKQITLP